MWFCFMRLLCCAAKPRRRCKCLESTHTSSLLKLDNFLPSLFLEPLIGDADPSPPGVLSVKASMSKEIDGKNRTISARMFEDAVHVPPVHHDSQMFLWKRRRGLRPVWHGNLRHAMLRGRRPHLRWQPGLERVHDILMERLAATRTASVWRCTSSSC